MSKDNEIKTINQCIKELKELYWEQIKLQQRINEVSQIIQEIKDNLTKSVNF